MSENIVVNVEFEGTTLGTISEIQVVPSDIAWEDLELMLKVYAGHEEEDSLLVKYEDDDNDQITIGTQEELQEAFKVAKKSNNTLHLKVVCNPVPDKGIQDGNVVVKADVFSQSVSMATKPNLEPTAPEMPTTTEEVLMKDVTTTESDKMETGEAVNDAEETKNTEGETEKMNCDDEEDEKTGATATKAPKKKSSVTSTEKKSKFFYIKNNATELVLDINGGNSREGTAVIIWPQKSGGPDVANQLWYWDTKTTTIRSALNELCLDVSGREAKMQQYQMGKTSQQWCVTHGHIQHRFNPNWVVASPHQTPGSMVVAADASSVPNKEWKIEYKNYTSKDTPCTNKETGEQCITKQQVVRPKVSKRAGKKDHYAEMAREIGRNPQLLHRGPADTSGSTAKKAKCTATADVPEGNPPTWFFKYMDKFKKEITDDMAKLVARRTVHQVLKGLNNAVIETVKVNDVGMVRAPVRAPVERIPTQEEPEPVYLHHGVVCDICERPIVGIRYKCGNCEDFDLCEQCERTDYPHDPNHVFLKIKRPVRGVGCKRNGQMMPLLKSELYGQDELFTSVGDMRQKQDEKRKKSEKLLRKYEKLEEKLHRKEEKLKRHLEITKEQPKKKEKLDIPQIKTVGQIDLEFLRDETIPDGTHVQPGTKLTKKWQVKNSGLHVWTENFRLTMMWGNMTAVESDVDVPSLASEEEGLVTVELIAPVEPGIYQSHWRLSHCGRRFGHRMWCSVVVDSKEVLEPVNDDSAMLTVTEEDHQMQEEEIKESSMPKIIMDVPKASSAPPTPDVPEGSQDNAELYHFMSYETLAIGDRDRPRAKASQTATPNNTPRDVSPPKSPIPELHILSNSSSVEVVSADHEDDGIDEEAMSRMTELVQERMASLGLKPDEREDDTESWSSYEEDLSDDTDSDFYVVPIPDCFNPELPPATSASTSIIVKKEDKSIDEMLTASHSLESQPLLTPQPTSTKPHIETLDDSDSDNDDVIIVRVELPRQNSCQKDSTVIISDEEEDEEECPRVQTVPKDVEVMEQMPEGAVGGAEREVEIVLQQLVIQDIQETDQNANLPLDINDNSAGTPNQEEPVGATPINLDAPRDVMDEDVAMETPTIDDDVPESGASATADPREISPSPGELAHHVAVAARGMATFATQAAHTAYSTAKDVFHTLQAKDKYTPPQSEWTPPASTWTPTQSEWTPTQSEWTPAQSDWTPPQSEWTPTEDTFVPPEPTVPENTPQTPMEQLIEMGFGDRRRNQHLLDRHNNELDKVIQALVQEDGNDWHSSRH